MPRHEVALEVLTDGGELTAPAVFLTIRRRSQTGVCCRKGVPSEIDGCVGDVCADGCVYHPEAGEAEQGTIVARYALTGLPTLTGRLAADQSFKLLQGGAFRAVLVPSLGGRFGDGGYGLRGAGVGGMPALFLGLVQSGYKVATPSVEGKSNGESSDSAPEDCDGARGKGPSASGGYGDVSIVGPSGIGNTIDGILDNMFGRVRRRPSIRMCEVPTACNWWKVYEDSYVKIWGQAVPHCHCSSREATLCVSCSTSEKKDQSASDEHSESDESDNSSDESSASERSASSNDECSIVYIVMLAGQDEEDGTRPYCFAIMPPTLSSTTCQRCANCKTELNKTLLQRASFSRYWNALRNLPEEIVSSSKGGNLLLDFILHLDPAVDGEDGNVNAHCNYSSDTPRRKRQRTESGRNDAGLVGRKVPGYRIPVPFFASKIAGQHLATFPDCNNGDSFGNGLLIRSWHRSQLLHDNLPFAFPISSHPIGNDSWVADPQIEGDATNESDRDVLSLESSVVAYQLRSCTLVILNGYELNAMDDSIEEPEQPFAFVTRRDGLHGRLKGSTENVDAGEKAELVRCAFNGGPCICGRCNEYRSSDVVDGNEIDLDGSFSDSDIPQPAVEGTAEEGPSIHDSLDVASPHILMLGTGCATPSPLRGSSAIGLLLPTLLDGRETLALSSIIECGEGTLTGLLRHLPLSSLDVQLSQVRFIWISHSHLDHYCDLLIVVQAIAHAKQTSKQQSAPLLVIAPSKVLRYLDILLPRQSNAPRNNHQRLYEGVTHRDFQHSPFAASLRKSFYNYALPCPTGSRRYHPFGLLRNVEVEHCREAFALILQLEVPTNGGIPESFSLCFSGDTRPSVRLVETCRSLQMLNSQSQFSQSTSLLIHEATFLHDSHGKNDAVKKRHSTTAEALDVAKSVNADGCILTHFSQRYQHVSVDDACLDQKLYPFSWGVAVDGLAIPLTKRALSRLLQLSQCVDSLLSQKEEGHSCRESKNR